MRKEPNVKTSRFVTFTRISIVSFILLTVRLQCSPAHALPATNDPPDQTIDCLGNLQGSISTAPQTVNLGQSATLSWNVKVPSGCTGVKLYVDNVAVSPIGSRIIQPIANTGYQLNALFLGGRRTLANA